MFGQFVRLRGLHRLPKYQRGCRAKKALTTLPPNCQGGSPFVPAAEANVGHALQPDAFATKDRRQPCFKFSFPMAA